MKTFTIFLLLATVAALWLACRGQQAPPLTSGIEGQVLIGPTCPVLREGTPCRDQPYQATIAVWNAERTEKVRTFTTDEVESIRGLIASDTGRSRAELSRLVCDMLRWERPDGRRKDMSCRVAMLRMHRNGLIELPRPRTTNGNGRRKPRLTSASDPQFPIALPVGELGKLEFRQIYERKESSLWNELIERHHYLGYEPLAGAQIRYFVFGRSRLLAALGFGASAWKTRPGCRATCCIPIAHRSWSSAPRKDCYRCSRDSGRSTW
ncbi:MAG: DUF4338 domain-containing protein [Chloroflexi bacterium]|nr:DUF4338 domain-containing protein [Chloroflexota bacterium]